jgi:hypothetical protein
MRVLRLGVKLSLAAAASMLALAGSPAGAQPPPEAPAPPGDAIGQLLQSTPQEPRLPVAKAAPPAATADADNDDDAVSDKPVAKAPPPPAKRIRRNAAIIQALDKVTAETLRFEADVNQPVRYKDLVFTVHVCEDSAPDEPQPASFAHIEIDSQPKPPPGQAAPPARQLFVGWMLSNAPAANPFEHPVYDAWLIACKTAAPGP